MYKKQSVLVTGSSSGIGRSISEVLARKGHTVFATMRQVDEKNAAAAQELKTLAQQENLDLHVLELDVTRDESVANAVDTAIQVAGAIDVLVNNAAVMTIGVSESFSAAQIQQMYDVNVMGVFRVTQAVLPFMRKHGAGYLLYVSSTASQIAYPFMGLYGSTKTAESAIAEALHYEVFSLGIDTTILQCGGFATSLSGNIVDGARAGIVEAYGMPGMVASAVRGGFASSLASSGDPKEVGAVIADLMQKPTGERPLFLPVGPFSESMAPINDVRVAVQDQVIKAMMLDGLTKR